MINLIWRGTVERLLDVGECAQRLGLKKSTIRRWLFDRRIASVKLGKSVRVPESEVDRLIQIGKRPAIELESGKG